MIRRRRYESPESRRKRQQDRLGFAIIVASLLGFAALFGGAAYLDAQRGITIAESLAAWGI